MSAHARPFFVVTAFLFFLVPAQAQEAASAPIAWRKDLPTGFAEAKAEKKILMICVNARLMKKSGIEESANKALREIVYKDARVVTKSREFVCVLFTPSSNSGEFGDLRLLGIEGDIVSPQHIFVSPDGKKVLVRQEYWTHGKGEAAGKALVAMMVKAQTRHLGVDAAPKAGEPKAGEIGAAPGAPTGDARPAWILARIGEVTSGTQKVRQTRIDQLVRSDKDGDCVGPLIALIEPNKKNEDLLIDLVCGLGRDKLLAAAEPIAGLLSHKDEHVRGYSAVSLEYIGSRDKAVVKALLRAAGKEKDIAIANHMYRALGRCGVDDSKARSTLLKKCGGAKSEFASYGPAIGLAYFEGDKKAARGMEKLLKKIGVPGGRRGGGQNTVKRGVYCWTLAAIEDRKSGDFVREELLAKLENVQAFWVGGLKSFYRSIARKCDGDKTVMVGIEQGVRGFVGYAKGANPERYDVEARSMMDAYRKNRDDGNFKPKGDGLLGSGGDV
jgi:hypothetical protein